MLLAAGCGEQGRDETTTIVKPPVNPPHERRARIPTGDGHGGVRLEKIGDFEQPLYVTQPRGDSEDLFVAEKGGTVRVLHDGEVNETPFLDISDEVSQGGEQGLLGMAFAPDYERSGLFYVNYTDTAGDTQVVEYRRSEEDPLVADPGSARTVLTVDQPSTNHNGGQLEFGAGGLYIGLGDGGFEEDPNRVGQDLSTLLGKILRIDPRPSGNAAYSVPRDNPFAGRKDARPEIYSYGLRNPWRFSFDPVTGALWIGDVGQYRFEEIDGVRPGVGRGANFGWSAFEGDAPFNEDQHAPNAIPPVLAYPHSQGCSVTGGYVVRDPRLRSLYGRYVYGDYCAGQLRSFTATPGRPATDDRPLGIHVPSPSSFGRDDFGHVYVTSLSGPVYEVVPENH